VAPPAGTLRVGRYFLALLALLALLYSIVFFGSRSTPKLGIDLVGGTEVRFTAKTQNGETPPQSSMTEARQILSERVNGTGVTQATVSQQGNDQLVVDIPGKDATDIKHLGAAAVLNFRGVVAAPVPVTCGTGATGGSKTSPSATPSGTPKSGSSASPAGSSSAPAPAKASGAPSNSGAAAAVRPLDAKPSGSSTSPKATKTSGAKNSSAPASATGSPTTTPTTATTAPTAPATATKCSKTSVSDAAKAGGFTVPLTGDAWDKLSQTDQTQLDAGLAGFDCASAPNERDQPDTYFIACAKGSDYGVAAPHVAFLLGPVIVAGHQIDTASALAPNAQQGQFGWSVQLSLKDSGQSAWAAYTSAHNVGGSQNSPPVTSCATGGTPCADFVAFTLDGQVLSAPVNLQAINGQNTQITGNFDSDSANDLANKLKFGALPLSFNADKAITVSATLGTAQLKAGLLAGGIGLILVVIYSLIYYRALGLVTIASLLVSGALTYGALVMLGTQIGFTLSLAGIAGFIVAVGITADSFVVFFERLKDEVHEGRSVRVAVPRAWVRARRTILSADTVSFLAAAVLYYFTTDEVRGFAFTLGLSTILDLIVVFLFTHPLISLLSRSAAFGSARFTGLDALRGTPAAAERPARRTRPTPAAATAEDVPVFADEPGTVATVTDDEPASEPEPAEDSDQPTAPPPGAQPGSAAERAAARRARMRQQKSDGEGER
jgi:preprotein translocase subunit SecD